MMMRLQFKSKAKAKSVARDFDLDGIHKHEMKGMTLYMPGKNHRKLNKELRKRNLPPAPKPSKKEMEEMKEMEMGVAGVFDMGLKGDKDGDGDMEIY